MKSLPIAISSRCQPLANLPILVQTFLRILLQWKKFENKPLNLVADDSSGKKLLEWNVICMASRRQSLLHVSQFVTAMRLIAFSMFYVFHNQRSIDKHKEFFKKQRERRKKSAFIRDFRMRGLVSLLISSYLYFAWIILLLLVISKTNNIQCTAHISDKVYFIKVWALSYIHCQSKMCMSKQRVSSTFFFCLQLT